MHRDPNAEMLRLTLTPAALDAGATIQDAVVRRLRFVRAADAGGSPRRWLEDRAPVEAVVGRKR